MRNFKAASAMVALCIIVTNVEAVWQERDTLRNQYGFYYGTSLCAGVGTEEDGITRQSVWVMIDGYRLNDNLWRYDVEEDTWRHIGTLPFYLKDQPDKGGGALAYVPDPFACPPNGWVFALHGDETNEFWVFLPSKGTWLRGPDMPEAVVDGGALCYGGIHTISGIKKAILYALTGQETGSEGHFYRYIFDVVPYKGNGSDDASLGGHWEPLRNVPGTVGDEASITWVPMSAPTSPYPMGLVVVLKNTEDNVGYFWHYDPATNNWLYVGSPELPKLKCGTRVTAHYKDSVMFLENSRQTDRGYGFYKVLDPRSLVRQTSTPYKITKGSGITAFIPNSDGVAYALFPAQAFGGFCRWLPPPYSEGGQGVKAPLSPSVSVTIQPGRNYHRFFVKSRSKMVTLLVADITGRRQALISGICQNGETELVWHHPQARTGLYFYQVSTGTEVADGKLLIAR